MITSIDSNVLFDLFRTDSLHHSQSRAWLRDAYDRGAVVVCDTVYAELVPKFGECNALDAALQEINVTVSPSDRSIACEAGIRWMRYRRSGGPRERIITDFLIGAHALVAADNFLTRDRGFYSTYFPELKGPFTN